MHGLIFSELQKYIQTKFDAKTWEAVQEKAGLKGNLYLASAAYPDGELMTLLSAACEMTGLQAKAVLEDFGDFICPNLIRQYGFLVKPEWSLVDFLCNTEETIHKIVRFHAGATPPQLMVRRIADDRVTISYDSERKMCALLKGMVKGAARHYKKSVSIVESRCMLEGAPECTVHVQVVAAAKQPGGAVPERATAAAAFSRK
ncbi:MAG TPA: heme NO-binding domain-containing protein [Candidatus Angelobacter sp.]|nr:heme NO-binding domain-containing protein [Candidatus Angelobacter sp.]